MSENKKTELNDAEIENVTGGTASTTPTNAQSAGSRDELEGQVRKPSGSGGTGGVNPTVKP
jgi:hypothetical protein